MEAPSKVCKSIVQDWWLGTANENTQIPVHKPQPDYLMGLIPASIINNGISPSGRVSLGNYVYTTILPRHYCELYYSTGYFTTSQGHQRHPLLTLQSFSDY